MPGFVKVLDAPVNGSKTVDIKTFTIMRQALMLDLKFSVIRSQGLGDVLMTVVVVEALKRMYPSSSISFHTFPIYHQLVKRFSFIDQVGTLEDIDTSTVLVDLMGKIDFLPLCDKAHRLDLLADEAAVPRVLINKDFSFAPTPDEKKWATAYLKQKGVKKGDILLGLHLKANADIRTWERSSCLALVEMVLQTFGPKYKVILFEQNQVELPQNMQIDRVINATGELNVTQTLAVIHALKILVCPDSGPMHLAGMMNVPFIGLFGPIDPDFRIRYYSKGEAIWIKPAGGPCPPCWDWQIRACKDKDYKTCMNSITPEMVLDRLKERLGNARKLH